ncbi:NAD(P)/FAD-dependent oxidoreductase [Streptomyces sp. WAC06614]|uniref:NAD(P)/FAD-dependent oxidoreductase n=1 Tax=Streptomyces sp. WAC06614 TaxID=2487416 RepID=UPI000F7B2A74|nr:NAD(P)/FAD-dependent oxidoreductase [Streptomyces sp. WAC06614]RSS80682.1 FAD-binding protein [Streptomyces sp. WAC06614]
MAGTRDERHDVVVVGAGAAGLACAADLVAAGLRVRLVEAEDTVGGRIRTDRVAGFTADRGFQVFNTSYPQVKRRLDLPGLFLRPFTPGVLVHTDAGRIRLADPTRRPRDGIGLLRGGRVAPRDVLAFGALSARALLAPASLLRARPDVTTRTALAEAGFSEDFVETVLRPFLSGVFLEDSLETSARFFHLVWRSMLRGTLCLPRDGIGAVPAQLAAGLPGAVLRTSSPVSALTSTGVVLGEEELPARAVVVATGAPAAARLLPGLRPPQGRTVTTLYHAVERSPLPEPTLLVDARRRFLNSCVLTEVQPGYAADGRALVSTSVLGAPTPAEEAAVLAALAEAYGTDTATWEPVHRVTVRDALPAMPPPLPLTRTTRIAPGRYACGDHRATGSLQGALASGAKAAREVLADLAP